jgi:branched-chain amino acid transport system permease protein
MDVGMDIIIQVTVWGLYAGCIYILLATGLNLIFGVMKVVNFAHGQLLMIGAYVTFTFFVISGFNPYVLLAASIPILIIIGVTIERLCFRPILGTGKLNEIFISIGLIYVLENVAAMIWSDEWLVIHSPYE